jgi:hypothetical protein
VFHLKGNKVTTKYVRIRSNKSSNKLNTTLETLKDFYLCKFEKDDISNLVLWRTTLQPSM